MASDDESAVKQALLGLLNDKADGVAHWLTEQFAKTRPSFYTSVDIRHSGYKLVPVDTNLFPAGFNNLSLPSQAEAVEHIAKYMARQDVAGRRVLVIPENHTRNRKYLESLNMLKSLLERAGCEVRVGTLQDVNEPIELEDASDAPLVQYPLVKDGNRLCTRDGFVPDLIIVNNDMTSGSPQLLKGVTQQVSPPVGQGWYRRKKTIHFTAYGEVADAFAAHFDIDPWLIQAAFHRCGLIDFKERKGIECVALGVEKVLRAVREKYAQYGVKDEPYVFIKADAGTYGMGIMTARSGEEVVEINKKIRNKMNTIKEGVHTTEVIIQEGVPTIDVVDGGSAEPMVYLIDGHPVGGAHRVHKERDGYANLNASGMYFVPMCEQASRDCMSRTPIALIAQLATLASAREEYGDDYMI